MIGRQASAMTILLLMLMTISASPCTASRRILGPAIVGGNDTPDGRFPYNVRIERRTSGGGRSTCSGSLVTPSIVLTAGHCVYDTGEDVLYAVSTYNITVGQDSKSAGNGIRSTVAEAAGHPQYTTADEIGLYDVGILKLSTAVPSSYQPVKLNYMRTTPADDGKQFEAVGWGRVQVNPSALPNHLQQATEYLRTTWEINTGCTNCSLPVSSSTTSPLPNAPPIPAACQGDSGGPLLVVGASVADDVQYGTLSYTYGTDCGRTSQPQVYMDVTHPSIQAFIRNYTLGPCPTACPTGSLGFEGNLTICPSSNQNNITVYCKPDGSTYLSVPSSPTSNFATYGPAANNQFKTSFTNYTKVRLNPNNLTINIEDVTYATNNNVHVCFGQSCSMVWEAYGTAGGCLSSWAAIGQGNIDLRGTGLAIASTQTFNHFDNSNVGSVTYSSNNQVADLTGGGSCGFFAPTTRPYIQLVYSNPSPAAV